MLPVERGLILKFLLLHLPSFTIEIILFMRGAKQGFQATGIPHSPAQLRACFNCTFVYNQYTMSLKKTAQL